MNPIIVMQIIALVLKLIAEGLSQSSAISEAAGIFGVNEGIISSLSD